MNWKEMLFSAGVWLHGLLGAIIGGAAASIGSMVVDPETFNFGDGLKKMGTVALISGIINGAFYLKGSPVPAIKAKADLMKLPPVG